MKKRLAYLMLPFMATGWLMLATTAVKAAPLTLPADTSKIYSVKGLAAGSVLKMHRTAGASDVIVNIPHNATWIVRRNAQQTANGVTWEKVTWGQDQTGWVDSNRLQFDAKATNIAQQRRACMNNPAVKLKMCCGYPESAKGHPFRSVPLYTVQGLKPGQSLFMYVDNGGASDAVAVEIPHNGTWVAKLGKVAKANNTAFELVRWAGQNGWVDAKHLRYDAAQTKIGDDKRRICGAKRTAGSAGAGSNRMTGGAAVQKLVTPQKPAESSVVCLPASVIRRLQEAGALDADTLKKFQAQNAAQGGK